MRTLIVGAGALGGLVAARMGALGYPVCLATRDAESAIKLRASGLRVTGVGGPAFANVAEVASTDEHCKRGSFELVILATKANDAIELSPRIAELLAPGGTLLPLQNGAVAQMLADRLGGHCVLGGLSNIGATMTILGVYEQRNSGHLLIGELAGRSSERAERVRRWLAPAVEVRVTSNLHGAIWSKLLLNCSVTTIGAIANMTMREYFALRDGRELFTRAYDEALSVALAGGARPARMLVDPLPPAWSGKNFSSAAHDAWLDEIVSAYGDLKPSMLQDFERGRRTEIDFINGYVVDLGRELGVPTPVHRAIVATVHAITRRQIPPGSKLLRRTIDASRSKGG